MHYVHCYWYCYWYYRVSLFRILSEYISAELKTGCRWALLRLPYQNRRFVNICPGASRGLLRGTVSLINYHTYSFCLLRFNAISLINRLHFIIVMIQLHIINALNSACKDEPGKTHSDNPPGQDLKLLLLVNVHKGCYKFCSGFGFRFGSTRLFRGLGFGIS